MAKRVNEQDIEQMKKLYAIYGTYAAVARETGWSAGTVSKYLSQAFKPTEKVDNRFANFDNQKMPTFSTEMWENKEYSEMCELTDEERERMKENGK